MFFFFAAPKKRTKRKALCATQTDAKNCNPRATAAKLARWRVLQTTPPLNAHPLLIFLRILIANALSNITKQG
jgi:hypothetical protein